MTTSSDSCVSGVWQPPENSHEDCHTHRHHSTQAEAGGWVASLKPAWAM